MDDAALIARCLDGDRRAFDELLAAHQERVFAICLRTLRDREAALDATQDTFVTVFRKLDRFDGRSAFSTWLYRVAVNTCYDRIRAERRRATVPLPEHLEPEGSTSTSLQRVQRRLFQAGIAARRRASARWAR